MPGPKTGKTKALPSISGIGGTSFGAYVREKTGGNGEAIFDLAWAIANGETFTPRVKRGGVWVEAEPEVPKLALRLEALRFLAAYAHGLPNQPLTLEEKPASELSDAEIRAEAAAIVARSQRAAEQTIEIEAQTAAVPSSATIEARPMPAALSVLGALKPAGALAAAMVPTVAPST